MTTTKLCPVIWTKEDGPCPCAFKDYRGNCNHNNPDPWAPPCIPMYKERYYHSLEEATSTCPQCDKPVVTTKGDFARGRIPLCPECSKEYQEQQALAAHIRGKI